ncbi:FAD-binding protein [Coraliomargarita sp. SDUM461004]|uniref:FAD-binding protein n=1 Tax=Thalassobacterium sedimentorum TaxID=3041258 RepID=A0ABU1AJ46_9BACT|nr:FAD-binding protein [Coraliomargarita sp. SDUM461004]MDQ8194178.1 FAD-binding protein [Coraliomargarita sp. SDUM461004]
MTTDFETTPVDGIASIPQNILDRLTRVDMPSVRGIDASNTCLEINTVSIPTYQCEALVLGSGAAGMRAAVELHRRGVDVLVASTGLFAGTSACSGSDKQTLYTASTDYKGDNFIQYAQSLCSGGAMDFSTAYVEAIGSNDAVGGLQFMGLPLPHDDQGAILRYQTDHDEAGRATSCGPRTSKLMVKVLFDEALTLGVRILPSTSGIRIVKETVDGEERVCGVIALHREESRNDFGLIFIQCEDLIIATGGPGELYRDSVYPHHCHGGLGLALEAGIELCNVTESQFGIGTPRTTFPWNLSGTYVQVMPRVYSVDHDGKEVNFLKRYYRSTREMVSNTFRKGYQWPFHSTRMLDYGSSLFDLAVYLECQAGRKVYLDFLRNPEPVNEGESFSLEDLDPDVRSYLENNEALYNLPIDRLRRMNPLAIELYRMHGTDLCREPLEFAMNNQHMNGGILINDWGQTSLAGCYAIGEAAGSHGVTRPGGAALNSGQVFGKRVAVAIKRSRLDKSAFEANQTTILQQICETLDDANAFVASANASARTPKDIKAEVQARMSDAAGIICSPDNVAEALVAARKLRREVEAQGLQVSSPSLVGQAFRWRHMVWVSEAVLTALDYYIQNGGGSRGARAICSPEGTRCPDASHEDLSRFRFVEEQAKDREEKLIVSREGENIRVHALPVDLTPEVKREFFEKGWGPYLIKEG